MKFCERPFTYAYLGQHGEVRPCGWMHYIIGNLYEQDLKEIWHGEEARKARESIRDGSFAYCRKQSCPMLERDELPDISEEELQDRAVESESPLHINIANDRICNIACTTCRTSIYCPPPREREQIDSVLKKLLPYTYHLKSLSMNGNGEFLANPSFLRLLENLHPEDADFHISFETNGILFDQEHWQRISHLGEFHISVTVTINSLRREVYRYLSGGFDYLKQTLENLRFLSELRREGQLEWLNVTMVVQESNFWEVPEYIRLFAHSEDYAIDNILMKPCYNWWGMKRDTYWFKNILNPLHPYHQEYLKILADDCWNEPKVYDWGCHNIREERMHPLFQEKQLSDLLLKLYSNSLGLPPAVYMKRCLERCGATHIGLYGENEHYDMVVQLLREAGADIVFRLSRLKDEPGVIPTISMLHFQPDTVDTILLLELFDKQNRTNNLRQLKFEGQIIDLKELIEGVGQ